MIHYLGNFHSITSAFSVLFINLPECDVNLELFLDEIRSINNRFRLPTLQSLAFIEEHSAHQYLKRIQTYSLCLNLLTINKDLLVDEVSLSQYKLLKLSDRGGLKYQTEQVLESIITLWKIFSIIISNSEMMCASAEGASRKIIIDCA